MSSNVFRCMLAADVDLDRLKFPCVVSAKLDGVRAIVRDGIVYSRSNKPIPNKYVQKLLGAYEHYDGELIVGDPRSKTVYRDTLSHVMSHDKADFYLRFYVFDHVSHPDEPWTKRVSRINLGRNVIPVKLHEQFTVANMKQLLMVEEDMLIFGYEGLIIRSPDAPYKRGRSTMNEGYLLKLKRFTDGEFEIVDFEERQRNENEATTNELGRTKRSSHQAGKTGRGDLGALVLRYADGVTFNCGTGFTDDERARIWQNRKDYLGLKAKVKYFAVGMKDLPRHPVWLGLRDERDIS